MAVQSSSFCEHCLLVCGCFLLSISMTIEANWLSVFYFFDLHVLFLVPWEKNSISLHVLIHLLGSISYFLNHPDTSLIHSFPRRFFLPSLITSLVLRVIQWCCPSNVILSSLCLKLTVFYKLVTCTYISIM